MLYLGWEFDKSIFWNFILLLLSRDGGKFRISLNYPDISHLKPKQDRLELCQAQFSYLLATH